MLFNSFVAVAIAVGLLGCASSPPERVEIQVPSLSSAVDIRSNTTFHKEEFKKLTWVIAPSIEFDGNIGRSQTGIHTIRGRQEALPGYYFATGLDDNEKAFDVVALLVTWAGDSFIALDEAIEKDGFEISLRKLDRRIVGRYDSKCVEEVAVDVPMNYLISHRQSGLNFRLFGQGENVDLYLPVFYIQGFLEALASKGR